MHTRNCAICSLVAAGCSRAEGHLEAAVETRQRTIGLDWLLVLTNQVGRNLCCGSFDQHLKAFFRRSRTFYYWRCKPTPSKAIKKGKKAKRHERGFPLGKDQAVPWRLVFFLFPSFLPTPKIHVGLLLFPFLSFHFLPPFLFSSQHVGLLLHFFRPQFVSSTATESVCLTFTQ